MLHWPPSLGSKPAMKWRGCSPRKVATHLAAMTALRRLKGSENVAQQDSNGNLAVKLLRTFTAQVEALQRYRGKGQQKVTVEHVNVNAGGQAIVGTVHPGPTKKFDEAI